MKKVFCALLAMIPLVAHGLECELEYENDLIAVLKVVIEPYEFIGLHADELPAVIISEKGGEIKRVEQDGSLKDVVFPAGVPVVRPRNLDLHESINCFQDPFEFVMVIFKTMEQISTDESGECSAAIEKS